MYVLVAQLCLTLCTPLDCSPPGSSVHGILQARILEWVAFPSPADLPHPEIKPRSPAHCRQILYCLSHEGSPVCVCMYIYISIYIYIYIYVQICLFVSFSKSQPGLL